MLHHKIACLVLLCFLSQAQAQTNNWRLDKNSQGIKVSTRAMPGSKIREIKGEVFVPASLASVLAVYQDFSSFPQWHHKNSKAVLLKRQSIDETYHYQNVVMPFPVADRDIVIHSVASQKGDEVVIRMNSGHAICTKLPLCQESRKKKNILIKKATGEIRFTPYKKGVNVVWKQHIEPGGKIPTWLVNKLLVDVPYHTLKNLLQQVKLKKYQR